MLFHADSQTPVEVDNQHETAALAHFADHFAVQLNQQCWWFFFKNVQKYSKIFQKLTTFVKNKVK